MPSMVVISLNSEIAFIFFVQARTTFPFRITEQAPQTPVPHPTFTPVRPIRRRTAAKLSFSGSQTTNLSMPLIVKLNLVSFMSCSLSRVIKEIDRSPIGLEFPTGSFLRVNANHSILPIFCMAYNKQQTTAKGQRKQPCRMRNTTGLFSLANVDAPLY